MATPRVAKSDGDDSAEHNSNKSDVIIADNFPSKAFLVIEYCDSNDSQVACWSDDGVNFVVKDTAEFAASHLPRYFRHSNFQSFVRQLNLYGFRTIKLKQDGLKTDGGPQPVVFHHKYFQRGRSDLLNKIQRSRKGDRPRKSRSTKDVTGAAAEESKEDTICFSKRFDMLQDQMDQLSSKLDLLINLVTDSQSTQVHVSHIGVKRRRGSSTSETGGTSLSDLSVTSQSSVASKASPRYAPNMEVLVEEQKECGYGSSYHIDGASNVASMGGDYEPQAHDAQYNPEDNKEFQDFVSMMLVDNGNSTRCDEEEADDVESGNLDGAAEAGDSKTTMTCNLRNKVEPATVEGTEEIPETTVSATAAVAPNEEYDEEACVQPPLAAAVEVTDAAPTAIEVTDATPATILERKWWTKTKILLLVVVILVLIAFIVWPVVVFTKDDDDDGRKKKKGPPLEHRPPPDRNNTLLDEFNETIRDKVNETITEIIDENSDANRTVAPRNGNIFFGRGENPGHRSRPDPSSRYPQPQGSSQETEDKNDLFIVDWKGQAFQCNSVF